MVDKHSPDWDQMETWDSGSGGYIGATLLSGGLGTASDPDLSIVRTLVADVDKDGRVLSGYLVEFVSPDVQESQFKEYVEQWLTGDFGNKPMLVAEYTVGYASTSAMFYAPDKAPIPVTMRLVEKIGTGKTAAAEWFCYESGYFDIEMCEPKPVGAPPSDECADGPTIEVTCVCVSGCYDHGDGGDGGDGCPPEGCDTGGSDGGDDDDDDSDDDDSDDDDSDDEQITFEFWCTASITRGGRAYCMVTVSYPEGVEEKQHTFNWSSTTGASLSVSHTNRSEWPGKATETVTVSLFVDSGIDTSATVVVEPRTDYKAPKMYAPESYESEPRESGLLGYYRPWPLAPPGEDPYTYAYQYAPEPDSGTGPWTGSFMTGNISAFGSVLHISDDYDGFQHPDVDSTCVQASENLGDYGSYSEVNAHCGTSPGFIAMRIAILAHEREHEAGFNACMTNTSAFSELEAIVGSSSDDVESSITSEWLTFLPKLANAGEYASAYGGGANAWWFRHSDAWLKGLLTIPAHGSGIGC